MVTLQRWRHSPAAAAHAPAGHPRQHPALPRAAAAHHQRPAAVSLAVELSTKFRKSFRNIRERVAFHNYSDVHDKNINQLEKLKAAKAA